MFRARFAIWLNSIVLAKTKSNYLFVARTSELSANGIDQQQSRDRYWDCVKWFAKIRINDKLKLNDKAANTEWWNHSSRVSVCAFVRLYLFARMDRPQAKQKHIYLFYHIIWVKKRSSGMSRSMTRSTFMFAQIKSKCRKQKSLMALFFLPYFDYRMAW